jgi:hypothetical protein
LNASDMTDAKPHVEVEQLFWADEITHKAVSDE